MTPRRQRLRWPATAGALVTVIMSLATTGSPAACPESQYQVTSTDTVTTTAGVCAAEDTGGYSIAFDLPQGTVAMSQPGTLRGAWVEAADAYDVVGVPTGTPVALTVLFTVDGSVWTPGCGGTGCSGYVTIRVTHGAAYAETTYAIHLWSGSQSFHDVRRLPVTIVAGTPEVISFKLRGGRSPGGDHGSEGHGQIGFVEIPAGVTVVSCQGFDAQPTAARKRSWGALKSIYR